MNLFRTIQAKFYNLIRPLLLSDIDSNDDFTCGTCRKPILRRFLFCSVECANKSSFCSLEGKDE